MVREGSERDGETSSGDSTVVAFIYRPRPRGRHSRHSQRTLPEADCEGRVQTMFLEASYVYVGALEGPMTSGRVQ